MPTAAPRPTAPLNQLLASLPPDEYDRLLADLEPFPLVLSTVLYAPGEAMRHAYFPHLGVVSLVTLMRDGKGVEAATIGNEGMVGLPIFFGQTLASALWVVQVADGSQRISREALLGHLETMPQFRIALSRYAGRLFDQVAQSGACNALHTLSARCARWLLLTHDRMGRKDYFLTQDFLAQMLGVHRPNVSAAVRVLQTAGLIRFTRGSVAILDRAGLEASACECYGATQDRFSRDY